jgi:hypothetical protein
LRSERELVGLFNVKGNFAFSVVVFIIRALYNTFNINNYSVRGERKKRGKKSY